MIRVPSPSDWDSFWQGKEPIFNYFGDEVAAYPWCLSVPNEYAKLATHRIGIWRDRRYDDDWEFVVIHPNLLPARSWDIPFGLSHDSNA